MLAADSTIDVVQPPVARESWTAVGGRLARRWMSAAFDLVYPASCAGCRAEIDAADEPPFCRVCRGRLPLLRGPVCMRCAAPVPGQVPRDRCHVCRGTRLWFDATVALGRYDGLLRDWLLRMKHARGDSLALAVGELIWQHCGERLAAQRPDVVVPVPMHWRRRIMRGANSPVILAERLAGHLRQPHSAALLRRTRHTPPQFSLPPSARPANVRDAFTVEAGYHLHQAHVLLVDDILTTGATCSAAAQALKRAGASQVTVAVAARTLHH